MCLASNQTKKIELLNKVISSLEKAGYEQTNVMSHALLIRAIAYLNSDIIDPNRALDDATRAAEINDFNGRAYRVKADAYEALGDVLRAMEAVEKWANLNPTFVSKAQVELSRLSQKCNQ